MRLLDSTRVINSIIFRNLVKLICLTICRQYRVQIISRVVLVWNLASRKYRNREQAHMDIQHREEQEVTQHYVPNDGGHRSRHSRGYQAERMVWQAWAIPLHIEYPLHNLSVFHKFCVYRTCINYIRFLFDSLRRPGHPAPTQ